ncbi:leucine-rich repeats and immunoglobulin-like domains protein 1, partial [Saccoglossus kowalevskii]
SGLYACIASNTAGTDKKSLHVTYIEAARIRLLRRKVLVEYGETAKLNCPAKGIPPPIITWFKEGIPVLSSGFTEVQPNGDLVIVGTKEMDSGEYTCIATNSAGSDSDVITLDVG